MSETCSVPSAALSHCLLWIENMMGITGLESDPDLAADVAALRSAMQVPDPLQIARDAQHLLATELANANRALNLMDEARANKVRELMRIKKLPLYRRVEMANGESAEPVSVVGVHPLRWRAGQMLDVLEPTHAFCAMDWDAWDAIQEQIDVVPQDLA